MFFIRIKVFICFLLLLSGCEFSKYQSTNLKYIHNIDIETPNNKYDMLLKKNLDRLFNNQPKKDTNFILKSNISFTSNETLSVSGLNVLQSTKGTVQYSLIDTKSGKVLRSGSLVTFPALSSSSNSLYTNDVSLQHIKERLIFTSAKKLYLKIKLIMKKLN
jgi:hypothetical protein